MGNFSFLGKENGYNDWQLMTLFLLQVILLWLTAGLNPQQPLA